MVMINDSHFPLFETKKAKGSLIYKLFAVSNFVGIIFIWVYRATHIAGFTDGGKLIWIGMFGAELWFGLYWIFTQALRWNCVYRQTFKNRLAERYENDLPDVDIFVCTADPTIEPPMMVINTVLSVMAYDYPTEKLSVYLSDDAGSDLTFYALLEASYFARHWLPYCKKFKVEPRSPEAYFRSELSQLDADQVKALASVKRLYEDMENKVELAKRLERVSKSALLEHKGFSKWDKFSSRGDHDTILQVLLDGKDAEVKDIEGCRLPTLVYLAREKRPQHFHNFKAGVMNALIRVSSEISNGPIILNVDCDMYSNNSQAIRDVLCFFMDEKKGHETAFVQFPQNFHNITKNDLYGGTLRMISEVEFHGLDGYGGPMYIGTGCFHRRDTLCGRKYTKGFTIDWNKNITRKTGESVQELEERIKGLASCTFEENTQWGNEMGLKYGCPVEDVITGLSIQCRGWKSIYFNPERKGFLGVSATTLDQTLVQHKRWSEGDLQIFLSKYSPVWYGLGRIHFGLIMGYFNYCLWSPNCFATLYYSIVPSLYLLKGISLFPQVSSLWFLPFAYVIAAEHIYSIIEFLRAGGTILSWWNEQRMWLYKRTSSYLFAVMDTIFKLMGYSNSGFVISTKVADQDVTQRYEQEKMEFGVTSPMFIILSSVAMINLFCLFGILKKMIVIGEFKSVYETTALQILLCGVLVLINLPLYNGLFFRRDKGRMPSSVTVKSVVFAVSLCTCFAFL
ncbi:cellulose synthase E1 [Olea europaea subsp. europaea]|uniref:Cellulose synthase E1 n=1 Tax=Olea europaea subsp. europaea TaxID=158383 RepID=A0A8S0S5D3_OLEEU|nr:cellulose synthase E1 [Olea europaea subsp. europaea]